MQFPAFHFIFHCDLGNFSPYLRAFYDYRSPFISKEVFISRISQNRRLMLWMKHAVRLHRFPSHSLTGPLKEFPPEIISCSDLPLNHSQWSVSQAEQMSWHGSKWVQTWRATIDYVNVHIYYLSVIELLHVILYV